MMRTNKMGCDTAGRRPRSESKRKSTAATGDAVRMCTPRFKRNEMQICNEEYRIWPGGGRMGRGPYDLVPDEAGRTCNGESCETICKIIIIVTFADY